MQDGLISKMFSWMTHANYDDSTLQEWLMGLALIIILAFLWATVVRQVVEPAVGVIGETLS